MDALISCLRHDVDGLFDTGREQLIFECMIANLFEEYRFFPKYPERQLKIAAILFGELL